MSQMQFLCREQGYNPETTAFLEDVWQKIKNDSEGYAVFMEQLQVYENNITAFEHYPMLEKVQAVGKAVGVSPATMDLVLLIFMLPILRRQYEALNFPMRYYDSIVRAFRDTAEKAMEKDGAPVAVNAWWSMAFFKLRMFNIGRLQFKWRPFKESYTLGDLVIEEGTDQIEVHIPGGAPLTPEAVHAAYAEARPFFEARYNKKGLIFGCKSWLLSSTLDEILPPTSNILAFAHDYTILAEKVDPTGERVGHFIFGADADFTNVDSLPEKSTLHRGIKARLKAGKGIGIGVGVILPKE